VQLGIKAQNIPELVYVISTWGYSLLYSQYGESVSITNFIITFQTLHYRPLEHRSISTVCHPTENTKFQHKIPTPNSLSRITYMKTLGHKKYNFLPNPNYWLTLWSRILLEKLTGFRLAKKFLAFYWIRWFITAFTNVRQLTSAPHCGRCNKSLKL
jgi:hypothetical protein